MIQVRTEMMINIEERTKTNQMMMNTENGKTRRNIVTMMMMKVTKQCL